MTSVAEYLHRQWRMLGVWIDNEGTRERSRELSEAALLLGEIHRLCQTLKMDIGRLDQRLSNALALLERATSSGQRPPF